MAMLRHALGVNIMVRSSHAAAPLSEGGGRMTVVSGGCVAPVIWARPCAGLADRAAAQLTRQMQCLVLGM